MRAQARLRQGIRHAVIVVVWMLLPLSAFSFSRAILIASGIGQVPSTDAVNYRVEDLGRRLHDVEIDLNQLKPDVAVMKSDMAEMKWVARGAAAGVVAQILMVAFGLPLKRRLEDRNE